MFNVKKSIADCCILQLVAAYIVHREVIFLFVQVNELFYYLPS